MDFIKKTLQELSQNGLLRIPKVISEIHGAEIVIGGKKYVNFCTNDYLGLGQSAEVRNAAAKAIKKFGWSTASARTLSGTTVWHEALEQKIARFKRTQSAMLFTSGYTANIGVLSALAGMPGSFIAADESNHASLIDGARLSRAKVYVYKHRDMDDLEKGLRRNRGCKNKFIVTDTVFSMNGDIAPLKDIVQLARRYGCYVIADEAHGTGVLGKNGRGAAELLGVEKDISVSIGTLSKAFGSIGGFAAADGEIIDFIRNKARPFIFTTSFPVPVCAAGIAAIETAERKPGLRKKLMANAIYLRNALSEIKNKNEKWKMKNEERRPNPGSRIPDDVLASSSFLFPPSARTPGFGHQTPIIPVVIGDNERTLKMANHLWENGIYTPAIRPPTVPEKMSRLRITVTAMHTKKQLEKLIQSIQNAK
ncbi:MAG: 8-amino-7-oxononanoate synthase [Planctomycetes bacterium]|nr:8-amino-7-oxononanoate synthase [Planctomycetota bacterium]